MTEAVAISLQRIHFAYAGGPQALTDISLEVVEGEFIGVVGPNAGGKTTLLKIILGLLRADSGTVRVLGDLPERRRVKIGYVPQYPKFSREFPITVEEMVLSGRLGTGGILGRYSAADRKIAREMMEETEVGAVAKRLLSTLSGGQLQRALLARALTCRPRILILDEPTANIDMRIESDIFDLLKLLNRRMTILVVSHDIAFISRYVHRVACLNRTLVCHPTHSIDGQVISDLYDQAVHMVSHEHH